MKLFSILQQSLDLRFSSDPDAPVQTIVFDQDPEDSSNVRMRVTPPVGAEEAVEIVFDRNGHERQRRLWPVKYPAYDQRSPDDIDANVAKQETDAQGTQEAVNVEVTKQQELAYSNRRDKAGAGKGRDR